MQNQATLDGSPVAQCILKFMEDKAEHTASASGLHKRLAAVAEDLGSNGTGHGRRVPGGYGRRLKEVLPVLLAVGVEASRARPDNGTVIALRKLPISNASNASAEQIPLGYRGYHWQYTDDANASSNARIESNASANASEIPAKQAASGNTGITRNAFRGLFGRGDRLPR